MLKKNIPNITIVMIRYIYSEKENPRKIKTIIFIPCFQVINAACVATVDCLFLVNDLINGAIIGPDAPMNIVRNDDIKPTRPMLLLDILMFLDWGTYIEYKINIPIKDWIMCLGKSINIIPAIETPINEPNINGVKYFKSICSRSITALVELELICITAWTGTIASGFKIFTIIRIKSAPPPSPNEAVIVDVI